MPGKSAAWEPLLLGFRTGIRIAARFRARRMKIRRFSVGFSSSGSELLLSIQNSRLLLRTAPQSCWPQGNEEFPHGN
jgi:hypothetical protein